MQEPKYILTKEFLEEHYVKHRKSARQICEETGIRSHNSIYQAIKRHNVWRRSLKDSHHILTYEFLQEHYVNQNKSLKTIAIEIGFKRKSIVKDALIQHGIEVRKHTKSVQFYKQALSRRRHHTIPSAWFTSFKTRAISKNIEFSITIDDVWDIFYHQHGCCQYTSIPLQISFKDKRSEITASIDRIDSAKGYTKTNIQIVHKDINLMKSNLSEKSFLNYCCLISKKYDL